MDKLSALPPLGRLRAFEAAARLESFTGAADELYLTQTAVSKQIAALEDYLGVPLFERRNRGVFLTEQGRRFGRVVSAALGDIAFEAARLRGATQSNELVLHCQLCEAFYWLMPRLSRFHERHPSLELRVISASATLTEATEPFDIALQTTGRAAGAAQLAFTAADEIFPVASPGIVDGRTLPLSISDLNEFTLLAHRVIPQVWMDWEAWFDALGAGPHKATRTLVFDNFPVVLQAAVAGQGVALGWGRSVEGLIAEGKLVRLCNESVHRADELSVYRGNRSDKEEAIEALLSWLRDELG
ncbi:LysR family transcriptional regulator [Granulosicoccus antarcticus]|uniref:Glycine cleavage system transcriptional activator n=1 Tax=Granulosicoccus antarcticus IMCC3135 TaxID=1192854 RepID=A0A2Z2NLK7_9GAMM|nr:LysR family transcriptional regulator [Granulosicoccus antarcticus]ASJ70658.1 Glycine cleavage system transcriptional activator [Granulosicoccus antarcticus IMCC3135]